MKKSKFIGEQVLVMSLNKNGEYFLTKTCSPCFVGPDGKKYIRVFGISGAVEMDRIKKVESDD
jgi:hypothetical protein